MKKHLPTILVLTALLALGACGKQPGVMAGPNSIMGMKKESDARLFNQAKDAVAAENMTEAVRLYRLLYKQDQDNKDIALRYAQLLRKTGKTQNALQVLAPFTVEKGGGLKTGADPEMLQELAAVYVADGNFSHAETALNAVLENSKAKSLHIEAYNLMGVVLDARGQHKEAELMFNQALDGWTGNPASVMNNLALSLANQGLFDQSLTTLRKALVISPDKEEVARNIQIVQDLRDNIVPGAPLRVAPGKKVIAPKVKKQPACEPCPVPAPAAAPGPG